MSEIIDYMLEKIMNWVDSWVIWEMIQDGDPNESLNIEVEFKDGHREVISLLRET